MQHPMIGRLTLLMVLMGLGSLCAQQPLDNPDSLLALEYPVLFGRIKEAGQDSVNQQLYLKAYLEKAVKENNDAQRIQGYKN